MKRAVPFFTLSAIVAAVAIAACGSSSSSVHQAPDAADDADVDAPYQGPRCSPPNKTCLGKGCTQTCVCDDAAAAEYDVYCPTVGDVHRAGTCECDLSPDFDAASRD